MKSPKQNVTDKNYRVTKGRQLCRPDIVSGMERLLALLDTRPGTVEYLA